MAFTFVPAPQEQAYYAGLFAAADVQRQGSIGGTQAVEFFMRSKLPVDTLKNIWVLADQNPNNNFLDARKFAIALRLIQLAQNGVKGQGAQLDAPPGMVLRPVFFEGVSGVTQPMPPPSAPQPQQQQQQPPPPQAHAPPQQQQQQPHPSQAGHHPPPAQYSGAHPQQQHQQQQHQHPGLPPLVPHKPQQQQQMQAPPSPHRAHPASRSTTPLPPQAGASSMALTVQDPYTLLPNEQSRYEGLFPQYAKPDGFVYGKEAVDLFNKSGLSQEQLRDIWTMVDTPVDNRLDRLEFAMAMHLIVCISKKNLPMPSQLPPPLKSLKSQQQQQQPAMQQPPIPQQQQHYAPTQQRSPTPVMRQQPPPQIQQPIMQQPPQMQQPAIQPPPQMQQPMMQQQPQMQQPGQYQLPPRQQPSPMTVPPSIPSPSLQSLPSPPRMVSQMPSLYPSPPQQQHHFGQLNSSPPSIQAPSLYAAPSGAESLGNQSAPISEPKPFQQSVMSISDAFEGLTTLAAREGYAVSLPDPSELPAPTSFAMSSLPAMSSAYISDPGDEDDDDDDVEEIPVQQNYATRRTTPPPPPPKPKTTEELAASYTMGDDHMELEKLKTVLQRLQAENISLKAQLGSMTEEERNIQKEMSATIAEISKLSNELTNLRAQVLAAKSRLLEASAELKSVKEKKGVLSDLITETRATKEAMDAANEGVEAIHDAQQHPAPQPVSYNNFDLFSFDGGAMGSAVPLPAEAAHKEANHEPPRPDYQKDREGNLSQQGYSNEVSQTTVASTPAPVPQYNSESVFRPAPVGKDHSRSVPVVTAHSNNSYEQDGVMGGSAAPAAPLTTTFSGDSRYAPGSDEVKRIEDLKKKAQDAEQTAQQTEESRRLLVAQADELRRVADEAEATLRERQQAASEHKKRGFLGGGKKKDQKALDELQRDAQEKRKAYLAAHAEANDAQALAMETKREAERLRQNAEQAELNAASMASLEQQPAASNGGMVAAPQPAPLPYTNGFPSHVSATPAYGGHTEKPQSDHSGFGGGAMGYGFAPNVMMRGGTEDNGLSIPGPDELAKGGDPYSNPFSL